MISTRNTQNVKKIVIHSKKKNYFQGRSQILYHVESRLKQNGVFRDIFISYFTFQIAEYKWKQPGSDDLYIMSVIEDDHKIHFNGCAGWPVSLLFASNKYGFSLPGVRLATRLILIHVYGYMISVTGVSTTEVHSGRTSFWENRPDDHEYL